MWELWYKAEEYCWTRCLIVDVTVYWLIIDQTNRSIWSITYMWLLYPSTIWLIDCINWLCWLVYRLTYVIWCLYRTSSDRQTRHMIRMITWNLNGHLNDCLIDYLIDQAIIWSGTLCDFRTWLQNLYALWLICWLNSLVDLRESIFIAIDEMIFVAVWNIRLFRHHSEEMRLTDIVIHCVRLLDCPFVEKVSIGR